VQPQTPGSRSDRQTIEEGGGGGVLKIHELSRENAVAFINEPRGKGGE